MPSIAKANAEISMFEWNFDDVPANALAACCYWEYARESAFLLDLKRRWGEWDRSGKFPEELGRGIDRIQQASPRVFAHLQAILAEKRFPCPWQKLRKRDRRRLV